MKTRVILIFGESDNDTHALKQLVAAIRPELPRAEPRKHPIILARGAHEKKRASLAEGIAKIVAAQTVTHEVIAVIAHRDCDDIEPAHQINCKTLLDDMRKKNLPQPVAATPAFEIEAWWYLWPDALAATRACWSRLKPRSRVGVIKNAKDELRKELRPRNGGSRCPDYTESDSRKIAENIKNLNLIQKRKGSSDSFDEFVRQITNLRV